MELTKDQIREEINRKRKDSWIEAWFAIEVLAVKEDIAKDSMAKHIEKLSKIKDAFVYETKFSDVNEVKNPMKNVEKGYAQIAEVKLFVKNMTSLMSTVMLYGPSSIEILGPKDLKISLEEIQNIANSLAGVVHQFASAGVGGIVITPEKG